MRERAAIIVNPISGRGVALDRAQRVAVDLLRAGMVVSLHPTQAAGDGARLAREMAATAEVLLSVGGDGTLNEVLRGLIEGAADVPVAIVPTGTANVVASELGLPTDLEQLAWVARHGPVRRLDLGQAGTRRFAMCAGIGLDAAIVETVSRRRGGGITKLDYYWPTLETAARYGFPAMRVTVDGAVVDEESTFTLVANVRRYAAPFRFFNQATPDDGWLDVCCLHGHNMLDVLRYGWGAFWKILPRYADVTHFRGRRIEVEPIEPGRTIPVQVDGDEAGALPMCFTILPRAIGLCVAEMDPHGEGRSEMPPPEATDGA